MSATSVDMVNHLAEPDIVAHLRRFGWIEVLRVPKLGPCWEWNGGRLNERGGYGQIRIGGKTLRVHRLAYQAWTGDPGDLHVLHRCDNPPCLRPEHLFTGTDADNAVDKVVKGRGVNPAYASQDSPAAKLTSDDTVIIRQLILEGVSLAEIGRQFHITKQAVWRIKEGQTWTPSKMASK